MLELVTGLVNRAGPVGWPLVLLGLALWTMIALRWLHLREAEHAQGGSPEAYRRLIRVAVQVAPLLGLLGTVSGMVEAFSQMRGGGAVTEGIGAALVSTQIGLALAIPGLVAAHRLDRLQVRVTALAELRRSHRAT